LTRVGRKVLRIGLPVALGCVPLGWLALAQRLALALSAGVAVVACGRAADDSPALPPPTMGSQNDPFADANANALEFPEFEPRKELVLVAGSSQQIRVQVRPPGLHTVRFALVGQSQAAFLADNTKVTEPDGSTDTLLTVLSASPGFAVRAAVGRSVEEALRVVALEANLGSLNLTPRYPGRRTIQSWVASVHDGKSCSDLLGPPFPDGPELTISSEDAVQLNRVPAGRPLAAVVRAEEFAVGCRNIAALKAGTTTLAEVDIIDRPLQVGELNLRLSISVDSAPLLNPALDELAFRAVRLLNGNAGDDLAALLDVMSSLADDPVAFEQARTEQDWRGVLINGLAEGMPGSGLRSRVHDWMRVGLARLSEPDAIVGTLSAPDTAGQAGFSLTSVLGLPPASAGFSSANVASVSAETDDLLRVGTTLNWLPSPLLAEAAERTAIAERPGTRSSAAEGMSETFDCANLAGLIVATGDSPDEAFPDCDERCVLALCDGAMEVLWARVAGSNLPSVAWQISAAASAEIDAAARPTSLDGNWIGSLTLSEFGDGPIQGPFAGRPR
jgi:hypothetical protein